MGLNHLAELYNAQARYAEAGSLYERALAILEKRSDVEASEMKNLLEDYAAVLRQLRRLEEAETIARRAEHI